MDWSCAVWFWPWERRVLAEEPASFYRRPTGVHFDRQPRPRETSRSSRSARGLQNSGMSRQSKRSPRHRLLIPRRSHAGDGVLGQPGCHYDKFSIGRCERATTQARQEWPRSRPGRADTTAASRMSPIRGCEIAVSQPRAHRPTTTALRAATRSSCLGPRHPDPMRGFPCSVEDGTCRVTGCGVKQTIVPRI